MSLILKFIECDFNGKPMFLINCTRGSEELSHFCRPSKKISTTRVMFAQLLFEVDSK